MNRKGRTAILGLTILTVLGLGFGLGRYSVRSGETGGGGGSTMAATGDTGGADDMSGMEMDGMDMGRTSMPMDGSVRLSSADIATFGITFGTAGPRVVSRTVRAVGMVGFDETRMVYVAPKFGGWAERLHVDFTGQIVRAGEPLLDVYAPALITAQEELLLARGIEATVSGSVIEGVREGGRELFEAARRRLDFWDISQGQIERLLQTGEVPRALTLYAPASGVVMEKNVVEGQAFTPGANLYMIADLSEVWVSAEVFESDLPYLRQGMPAEVIVEALPGEAFRGRVEYVYPTLEDRTRSMRARLALANPAGTLRPGMFATARLTADLGERLTVPASAVLYSGERVLVFVDMGEAGIMPHEVTVGVRGSEYVEILAGVEAGARVVTSAQFLLDSESNLAEVMKAMMAQMNMSDMGGMDMEGMEMGGSDASGGMQMEMAPDSMSPADSVRGR